MISSRKSLRAAGVATAGAALLLGSALMAASPAAADPTSTRYSGSDRYATAAAAFEAATGGDDDVDDVVLAGGGDFPDALSANYLAGQLETGTLLTRANTLSPAAENAIDDSNASTVYIVGGTTAVSNTVAAQVRAIDNDDAAPITVVRVGGDNRYETNAEVNETATALGSPGGIQRTLVASGQGFADALAFGPVAYAAKVPLVLTPGNSLGEEARAQLTLRKLPVDLAGSTVSISTTTANQIRTATGSSVDRFGGDDRSGTATAIARYVTTESSPYGALFTANRTTVGLTNGLGFPDAVGAGPAVGSVGSVLLLTRNATNLGEAAGYASTVKSESARVLAFGGADVLPDSTVAAVVRAMDPTPPANG